MPILYKTSINRPLLADLLRFAPAMENLTSQVLLNKYLSLDTHFEQDDFVKMLIKTINNQNKQLLFYKNIECHIKNSKFEHEDEFIQKEQPMDYWFMLPYNDYNLYFITLTFDQKRFDNLDLVNEIDQKRYIIKQLYETRHYTGFIYGCFEKHKSGIIHSHLILETRDEEKVYETLQRAFSSRKDNKHAVDLSQVKDLNNTLRYINTDIDRDGHIDKQKHKYGFYFIKNDIYYNPKLL